AVPYTTLFRSAGSAAQRDMGVARPRPRCIRARRIAGTSGADALVPGAFAKGYSSDGDRGNPLLRHWRQQTLARLFRSDPARREDALRIADADRMGALRSRAL